MESNRPHMMGWISLRCAILGLILPMLPAMLAHFILGISWGARSNEAGLYYCIAITLFIALESAALLFGAIGRSSTPGKVGLAFSAGSLCLALLAAFFTAI